MTAAEIEIAVAAFIGYRRNIIVPNVFWGMALPFECDMVYITGSGYAHEIEIKTSKSDLVRDRKKRRHRIPATHQYQDNNIIGSRTFAIPLSMISCIPDIPKTYGIITVDEHGRCNRIRKAKNVAGSRKLTDKEILNVARLGTMRIWTLKRKLIERKPCQSDSR